MRATKTIYAFGAACMSLALATAVVAQDDLNDLLDIGAEEPAKKAETKPAAAKPVEVKKAEVKPVEVKKPEVKVAEPAKVAEVKPAEVKKPEVKATTNGVDDLLEIGAEEPKKVAEVKPAEVKKPEVKVAEPAKVAEVKPVEVKKPEVKVAEPAKVAEVKPVEVKKPEVKVAEKNADEVIKPATKPTAKQGLLDLDDFMKQVDDNEKPAKVADEKPAKVEEPAKVADEKPSKAEAPVKVADEKPAKAEEPAKVADEKPAKVEEPAKVADEKPAKVGEPAKVADEKPAKAEEPVKVAVAKKPVASEPPHPEAVLISELAATEKLRREVLDIQADREMKRAQQAYDDHDWDEAFKQYEHALAHLNDRPESAAKRLACRQGMAEAKYQAAKQAEKESDRETALKLLDEAINLHHAQAVQYKKSLEKIQPGDKATDYTDIEHVRNKKEYKKDRDAILKRLRLSAQYLAVADLARALEQCELVLRSDPYNQQAIALRDRIQRKRQMIIDKEREATRNGMIADVGAAWRPVYAVNSVELKAVDGGTTKTPVGGGERSIEQSIEKRMKEMILPQISFRPPATIIDVVDYFRQASKDYDRPEIPVDQRGFNFVLQLDKQLTAGGGAKDGKGKDDNAFSAASDDENAGANDGVPQIPNIAASNVSLWEALKLVCKISGFKFKVQGSVIMVMPKTMTTDELITRTYSVVESFVDRMNEASSGLKNDKAGEFGGGDNEKTESAGDADENQWKTYFEEMGVTWPNNSRIKYIKAVGKLRVTNTEDQLAILEDALTELNVTPSMIEIETRFVEVAQEDLNSLGFEWLMNSAYSFNIGGKIKKVLNLKDGVAQDTSGWQLVDGSMTETGNGVNSSTSSLSSSSDNSLSRSSTGNSSNNGSNNSTGSGGSSWTSDVNKNNTSTGNNTSSETGANNTARNSDWSSALARSGNWTFSDNSNRTAGGVSGGGSTWSPTNWTNDRTQSMNGSANGSRSFNRNGSGSSSSSSGSTFQNDLGSTFSNTTGYQSSDNGATTYANNSGRTYSNSSDTSSSGNSANNSSSGNNTSSSLTQDSTKSYVWQEGAGWVRGSDKTGKNALVNAIDGTTYQTGMRYLSTSGNHVSGEDLSTNDKFMRLNAFLGDADLSVILHMLSQRSDTDLLCAPKVVTKSGQEATIKVVTIYRYPTDYDVTIQSTSSSGGSYYSSGGSSGKILPMVEPQNFETQEVGVILTVTPDLSPEGLINLQLTPKIISEPEWRDFGMKVPMDAVTSNTSLVNLGNGVMSQIDTGSSGDSDDMQWFTVPMEQPFFKERSVDTHVTLYNGATIVMGGLITEERRSMEDKIPFLGDIPFIGRLFRNRSEWSNKRNLLIFVTARLVDPNGRQIIQNTGDKDANADKKDAKATPAPAAS